LKKKGVMTMGGVSQALKVNQTAWKKRLTGITTQEETRAEGKE